MKTLALILVLTLSAGALAQDWRDTLELARTAYKSKDFDKALVYYEKVQKSAPEGVDLSDEMGQSAYKAEKYDVAEKIYSQNQANKSTSKAQADNYHNLGNARMKEENFKGAVEAYKEALRRNPKDEKTRYNLSEAKRQIKKQQQQQQNSSQQDKSQEQNKNSENDSNEQQKPSENSSSSEPQNSDQKNQDQNQQKRGKDNAPKSNNKGQGQLSNKSAEKLLDDLMRREAETQRRMAGNGNSQGNPKSGKDW